MIPNAKKSNATVTKMKVNAAREAGWPAFGGNEEAGCEEDDDKKDAPVNSDCNPAQFPSFDDRRLVKKLPYCSRSGTECSKQRTQISRMTGKISGRLEVCLLM